MVKKPRPFSEKIKSAYLWIINLKFYTICFHCMPIWGLPKYIETKLWPFAFTSFQVFKKKNKMRSAASLPTSFFFIFFEKIYFSCYILLIDQVSLSGCLYFIKYWTIWVLQLFVNQVVTSWILKLPLAFLSNRFFYMTKKSWQKLKYLEN